LNVELVTVTLTTVNQS